jgi:hypothetical protein
MASNIWEQRAVAGVASNTADLAEMAQSTHEDFLLTGYTTSWNSGTINSGTVGNSEGTAKHPGIIRHVSHASNANSGSKTMSAINSILLGGGEKASFIFETAATIAGVTRRIGFHDAIDNNAPTDGVYFRIIDGTIVGMTANNGTASTSASNYTVAQDTWYRGVITLNTDATLATFTLFADDSTTVLWTDTLSTNIPITAGRETGIGDVCTLASPSGATAIGYLDRIDVMFSNARRVA